MRYLISFLSVFCLFTTAFSQNSGNPLLTKDVEIQQKWVDSIYNGMDLEEKIGQLYMVQAFSNKDEAHKKSIKQLITKYNIGGIIYSKGGPVRQAHLDNELQLVSEIPLLIGMDAEFSLGQRLDSTYSFPWNMTLGAINDLSLIEQTGKHVGAHCKRMGVHFNFAPVVDINTNPNNPIIGNRSFGEEKDNVALKSLAFMNGMQGEGVLASAKHFPGHGDTESDSHVTLPTVSFSKERINSVELYPYKKLIDNGLTSVMVAHLNVPSLDSRVGYPSSLSKPIVTDILKEQLQFKGLIITDALGMKGVSNYSSPGDIDLNALLAGNDILLMSGNVSKGIARIVKAYKKGVLTEERLSYSVKKILRAKYKVGLHEYKPIEIENLIEDLNRLEDDLLYEELFENAITVVKNKSNILPLKDLDKKAIAYVKLGDVSGLEFLENLKKYTNVHQVKANSLDEMLTKLKPYNTVVIGFHKSNKNPYKNHKFKNEELVWLYEIARHHKVILDLFAKPYSLMNIKTVKNIEGIVVSYQNSNVSQQKSAQLIFGAIDAKGNLPVTAGKHFKVGDGIHFKKIKRLSYGLPERVKMNSDKLRRLDSIAQLAVDSLMTPGIQLLVARKGKVVYDKTFGNHRYNEKQPVKYDDLYDVASLTKILATLPLLMELEEWGDVSLNSKLSDLLPEYEDSNKERITLKKMLSHYAKLSPWIAFYEPTINAETNLPDSLYYRAKSTGNYTVKVANNLFLRKDYQDSIQKTIKESELLKDLEYKYSDLPYYILKKFIEKYHDKGLDELVQTHFYKSLGANNTTYNPLNNYSKERIIPSEIDDYYRHQEVHGYVHDMGAAMQNGVGGHAGVFSNANDVAKIMQMYLQEGYYGGKRYFKPETIDKFNTCYYCKKDNRRGIGFDKPQLEEEGPTCGCVSMTSFGHSGFTGAYTWADPEQEIVYVFLANRTYPDANENKLLEQNIRTEIQKLIYEAIIH